MTEDRRSVDPYAPPPATSTDEPTDGESGESGSDDASVESGGDVELSGSSDDGLDDMRRMDLLKLAKDEGVGAYGTQADLIARIRKHRQS